MRFQATRLFTPTALCLLLPALFVFASVVAPLEIPRAKAAEREDIQLIKELGEGEVVDAIRYHGNVYFFVLGDNDISLWKTDGTRENTALVKRIAGESVWGENIITHRNSTSLPREKRGEPLLINGNFYFFTRASASGTEYLWQSDGTPAGTTRVTPLPESCRGLGDAYLMNGILYFLDSVCLWRTDGTSAGTRQVSRAFNLAEPPVIYKNYLYFSAFDDLHDQELWISDGTPGGTRLFADMNLIEDSICYPDDAASGRIAHTPCFSSSFPGNYTVYRNELYFTAFSPAVGVELWKTDGNGVRLVKDFYPGKNSGISSSPVAVFNNKLLICVADGEHGEELWTSDGTTAGTTLLKDIFPGAGTGVRCGDNPGVLNNSLFFSGNDGEHGESLWKTDGTAAGTVLVKDFPEANPYVTHSPFDNYVMDDRLYFSVGYFQFWVTDGTAAGTSILAENINWYYVEADHPGINSAIFNNRLILAAGDGNSPDLEDFELWVTDGTKAGTRLIRDILPGVDRDYGGEVSSAPKFFFAQGKSLLFFAGSSIYYEDNLYLRTRPGLFSLTMRDITLPWLTPLLLKSNKAQK